MSNLKSNDPLLAAMRKNQDVSPGEVGVDLRKNANVLRSQQGVLQRVQTRMDMSRSAGEAERKLRRIQNEGQVKIGQTAMDIFVGQTVKTMRTNGAAHDQALNNRLLVQEVNGGRDLAAISAEGMIRQADDHQSNLRAVQTRTSQGMYDTEDGQRLLDRLQGLNALTENAQSHAIGAALEDNAAYFQDARKKLRNQP